MNSVIDHGQTALSRYLPWGMHQRSISPLISATPKLEMLLRAFQ